MPGSRDPEMASVFIVLGLIAAACGLYLTIGVVIEVATQGWPS